MARFRPLRGKIVLEFARSLAGPLAGMMLADLGARVIKVEPPAGDETRGWGPPFVGTTSTYFASANRGKESLVLDLKQASSRPAVQELIRRSDIILENFRPGAARRLGLGPRAFRGKIHCSISGYGPGALADKPAYDLIIQAESGALWLNGDPQGPPMKIGITLADVLAAHRCVQEILAALVIGRPGTIRVSLMDSMLDGMTHHAESFASTGRVPARYGNEHPSLFPYGVFRTRDRWVAIGVANERQWEGLARVLGMPEWRRRYPSNASRVRSRDTLGRALVRSLKTWTSRRLLASLRRESVPSGPVQTLDEAFAMVGRSRSKAKAPRLGEHSNRILRWLGRS